MTEANDDFMADLETLPVNPDRAYHEHEGFNQSTANKLLSQSPRHAFEYRRWQKSKLGNEDPDHSRDREIGTVTHKLLLGSHTGYIEIEALDYRTKAAQQARAAAERAGLTPVLKPDMARCVRAANAMREQLREEFNIDLDGNSEVETYWEESGLKCKAKLDHVRADGATILDIKTGEDANPRKLIRRILDAGYHVQAACYSRGLAANFPELAGRVRFIDVFIETSGLVLCTPTEITGALLELGEREWLRACSTWAQCQERAFYPGYVTEVWRPECPEWALKEEMARG